MSTEESARGETKYDEWQVINLYRDNTLRLWGQAEERVREEYNAESASMGEIAAQAWAEYLGEPGPLSPKRGSDDE